MSAETQDSRVASNPSSNEQGPLWTPTLVVERLLHQARLSTTDQITMDRKQVEGLLFDVLRCRNDHSVCGAAVETTAPKDEFSRRWMDCLRGYVPCTYGDAIKAGWIEYGNCEPHEWDNRTSAENARWMLEALIQFRDWAMPQITPQSSEKTSAQSSGVGATRYVPALNGTAFLGMGKVNEFGWAPSDARFVLEDDYQRLLRERNEAAAEAELQRQVAATNLRTVADMQQGKP